MRGTGCGWLRTSPYRPAVFPSSARTTLVLVQMASGAAGSLHKRTEFRLFEEGRLPGIICLGPIETYKPEFRFIRYPCVTPKADQQRERVGTAGINYQCGLSQALFNLFLPGGYEMRRTQNQCPDRMSGYKLHAYGAQDTVQRFAAPHFSHESEAPCAMRVALHESAHRVPLRSVGLFADNGCNAFLDAPDEWRRVARRVNGIQDGFDLGRQLFAGAQDKILQRSCFCTHDHPRCGEITPLGDLSPGGLSVTPPARHVSFQPDWTIQADAVPTRAKKCPVQAGEAAQTS